MGTIIVALIAGMTGRVEYDEKGDRQPYYWLWGLGANNDTFELMADIRVNSVGEHVSQLIFEMEA